MRSFSFTGVKNMYDKNSILCNSQYIGNALSKCWNFATKLKKIM